MKWYGNEKKNISENSSYLILLCFALYLDQARFSVNEWYLMILFSPPHCFLFV